MDEEVLAQELAENGHTKFALRIVDGELQLVLVEFGFTIPGLEHEAFEMFQERMLRFANTLRRLHYPVVGLIFQRRKAKGRRHWAEFVCKTPEAGLPTEEADGRRQ